MLTKSCATIALAYVATMSAVMVRSLGAQSLVHPRKTAAVKITGDFREDGSCQILADGVPVFHPVDSAQSTYIRGAMLSVAPAGFETHELWCTPRTTDRPMPPLDQTERAFVVMLSARSGKLVTPRTYLVRTGLATSRTAAQQANAALFGITPQVYDDSVPVRIGLMYLAGTSGTLVVTRADTTRVVGSFVMRGQRALTM